VTLMVAWLEATEAWSLFLNGFHALPWKLPLDFCST
jgi:hypothetical protein